MEDIFNYGHPVYSFQNICTEDTDVRLNDGDFKHFFIAPLCARMIEDEELRAFFEFLISNRAGSSFTSTLRGYVEDVRHNMQWRFQFMTYLRQRNYDLEEGRSQKAIEAAENFLKEKVSPEIIAKCVDLPLEKVLELKEKLQVQN